MFRFPHQRPESLPGAPKEPIERIPRQAGELAVATAVKAPAPADVVAAMRERLPAREHSDTDLYVDRQVDSVIEAAIRNLSAQGMDIYEGRGAVVKLGVSHSKLLFEAVARRLTAALEAPVALDGTENYYGAMYDTNDANDHLQLSPAFRAYLDPAHVVEFLSGYGTGKPTWIEQADGSNEFYLPTAAGVWIDIRSGHSGDATGRHPAVPHAPEILLVAPSHGK